MSTVGTLRALLWYARRPGLWGDALWRAPRRLRGRRAQERAVAAEHAAGTAWCASVAVDVETALRLLRPDHAYRPASRQLAALIEEGLERERGVPEHMSGPASVDLLDNLTRALDARSIVETGVSTGWSSLVFLHHLDEVGDGRLGSTDMPYVARPGDEHVACVVPERLRDRWTLLRLPDRGGLPRLLRAMHPVDLAHYDSDKSYAGRMWAYPRLWDALRPGGLLVSDDIGDNTAFRDYAVRLGLEPVVVAVPPFMGFANPRYVGVLVKP